MFVAEVPISAIFEFGCDTSLVFAIASSENVVQTYPLEASYEGPDDVHVVGQNASKTKPAKFVVVFVKDKGATVVVPAN
jgi:hypothetical protein